MNGLPLAAIALLFALTAHSPAQCTDDAFEPNNTCTQSIDLAPGSYLGLILADGADRFDCLVPAFGKVTVDVFYDPIGLPALSMTSISWTSFCLGVGESIWTNAGHRRTVYANQGSTPRGLNIWLSPSNGHTCVPYDLYITEEAELGATPFCGIVGLHPNCPCADQGSELLHGCGNSTGSGVQLTGTGQSRLSADSLRLDATGFPPGVPALLVQATNGQSQSGVLLGDGVLCITGSIIRFPIRVAADGTAAWGQGVAGDPPISVSGQVPGAATRYYQVWYRNVADFCTPDAFNLSNGAYVVWFP